MLPDWFIRFDATFEKARGQAYVSKMWTNMKRNSHLVPARNHGKKLIQHRLSVGGNSLTVYPKKTATTRTGTRRTQTCEWFHFCGSCCKFWPSVRRQLHWSDLPFRPRPAVQWCPPGSLHNHWLPVHQTSPTHLHTRDEKRLSWWQTQPLYIFHFAVLWWKHRTIASLGMIFTATLVERGCLRLPPAHLVVVLIAVLHRWTIEAIVFLCKTSKQRRKLWCNRISEMA